MYLSGPVNNLADYQVEYGGLLLGKGTQYRIPVGGINFLDLAPVKTMDVQRIWADGSFSGPDFSDVLLPQLDLKVIGGGSLTQFQANVATLRNLTTIQTVGQGLWFKLPGFPVMGLNARVGQRNIPIDERWLRAGYTICALQFRAPDPAWQSVPRSLNLTASGAAVSGLTFPMFQPATYPYPAFTNASTNPNAVAASGFINNGGATWTTAVNVAVPATHPQGITTCASSTLNGAQTTPTLLSMYNIDTLSNTGAARTDGLWFYVNASGYQARVVGSAAIPLPANTWTWATGAIAANTYGQAYIEKMSGQGNASASDIGYITGVTAFTSGTPTATVSGGVAYPSTAAPTMSTAFTGTANASTSVAYTPVADFGATTTTSSSGVLSNSGNTPAWPVVTVPGPSSGFTVQVAGGYVTYSGSLQSTDTLVIDYSTGLATLNGTADRTALLTSRQFMPVPAGGTANVFFTASSGSCTVQTADIWR